MKVIPCPDVTPIPKTYKEPKPPKPLHRTGRLRPVSKKRLRYRGQYAFHVSMVFDRDDQRCLLAGPDCFGTLSPHHRLKAGQGGDDSPENLCVLCVFHNGDIEDRPWLYRDTPLWISMGVRYENGRLIRREAT
jgi:hypothetical protein